MLKNMKKSTKSNVITLGIVVGFYVLIQILSAAGALPNSFSGQLVPICAYVIMAVSLNLTVGMLGELSLGHAGFMSVGAFSGTLVYVVMSENAPQPLALLLAFVVGGAVAGLFGVLVGIPVLRLSGDYLAIVTLAFGEIVKNVMNACYLGVDSHGLHFSLKDSASLNLEVDGKVLINGAMGITGIKKASTFTIGIVLVIITLLVILNLVNSRAGRAIKAIREMRAQVNAAPGKKAPAIVLAEDGLQEKLAANETYFHLLAAVDELTVLPLEGEKPANAMAAVIQPLMTGGQTPWMLYFCGAALALVLTSIGVPALAFALGMFIPMELNAPLVVGGLVAWYVSTRSKDDAVNKARLDRGTLIASGFIAGGALMGVVSAVLKFAGADWYFGQWASSNGAEWLGLAMYAALIGYMAWHTMRAKPEQE